MGKRLWTLLIPFAVLSASCGTGSIGQATPSTLGSSSETTMAEGAEEAAAQTTTEAAARSTFRTTPTTADNGWAFEMAPYLESVALTSDDMIEAGFLADWKFRAGEIGTEDNTGASAEDETQCGFNRLNTSQGVHVRLLAEDQSLSQVIIPDAGESITQVIDGLPNCEAVTGGLDPIIVELRDPIAGSNDSVVFEVEDQTGFIGSVIMAAFDDSLVLLSYGSQVGHRTEDLAELVELVGSRLR